MVTDWEVLEFCHPSEFDRNITDISIGDIQRRQSHQNSRWDIDETTSSFDIYGESVG